MSGRAHGVACAAAFTLVGLVAGGCSATGPDLSGRVTAARAAHAHASAELTRLFEAAHAFGVFPGVELHPIEGGRGRGQWFEASGVVRTVDLRSARLSNGPAGVRFDALVLVFDPVHAERLADGPLPLPDAHLFVHGFGAGLPSVEQARAAGLVVVTTRRGGVLFDEPFHGFEVLLAD
ncbi:hypothetical protein Pla163_37400 [Planctomycetes bacterium Pla163]|uniref:Uncharacterized protein n=1 Tax=Rohdeia mirabilis TaxID=2528008 RepID=A0A518D548_9BACT|nr:hypothetical protein Pla163_37400 [Planctomycetes bacterium Pla163]